MRPELSPALTRLLVHVRDQLAPEPAHLDDVVEFLDGVMDAEVCRICALPRASFRKHYPRGKTLIAESVLKELRTSMIEEELIDLELSLPPGHAGWLDALIPSATLERASKEAA